MFRELDKHDETRYTPVILWWGGVDVPPHSNNVAGHKIPLDKIEKVCYTLQIEEAASISILQVTGIIREIVESKGGPLPAPNPCRGTLQSPFVFRG